MQKKTAATLDNIAGGIFRVSSRPSFPADTFDHRCLRRRRPESLPLPRHRSHKYV